MKTNKMVRWILSLYFVSIICGFCQNLSTNNLEVQTYSEVTTNWEYVTNSFDACYGAGNDTNNIYTVTYNYPDAYVGTVISNNICNVFYNRQLKSSFILNSKKIEQIEIVWENKTIYTTNHYNLN